ncbi:MAG: HNH endonuclease [Methyloceanibacter sp.]
MVTVELHYPEPKTLVYPAVGRCIYCGKGPKAGPLTREHIIPKALSGTLILLKSSCHACQRNINKRTEAPLLSTLRYPRYHLGLKSRNKRRDKTAPRPKFLIGRKGAPDQIEVPKAEHPYWLIACSFAEAALLSGADPTKKPLIGIRMLPPPDWSYRWAVSGTNVEIDYRFDTRVYQRALAKIAHAFAVANRGLNGFEPFLPPIILEESEDTHLYIGGAPDEPLMPNVLHRISLIERDGLLLVGLTLFANQKEVPSYLVVVGKTP